jgi:hypothetical protein
VEHAAFERAAQSLGIDDKAAIVRADESLDPDMSGLAIHLDLRNLRNDSLTTVRVRDAAAGQDVAICARPA